MASLEETIEENAKGPRRVSGDSGSMEQHSIPDQIAADKYKKEVAATQGTRRGWPISVVKFIPPGAND